MNIRSTLLAASGAVFIAALAAQAQVPGVNSTLNSVFTLAYDNSTMKQTFSAQQTFTPAAAPTDVCSIQGSATKTIKVRRIIFAGTAGSAIVTEHVSIVKRSTANTLGAGLTMAQVPYDSSNAAGTSALVEVWTGAPTLGTLVGVLTDLPIGFYNTSTGQVPATTFTFGQLGQPIVLRGVAQSVAVNMFGQGGGTGTLTCTIEWTEE